MNYNKMLKNILFIKSKHYIMKSNLMPPYGNSDNVIPKNDLVNRIFRKYSIYSGKLKASYYNRYTNIRNYLLSLYKHINYDTVYTNVTNQSKFNTLLVKELLYRLYYDIDYDPVCEYCKINKVEFVGERMWKTYCCSECQYKNTNNKIKLTICKQYNVDPSNITKLSDIKEYENKRLEQCRKTYKERYGVSWYNNRDKMKETKLKNWGCTNWVNPQLSLQTKLERYGSFSYLGQRAKESFLRNHPEGYSYILNKSKQTCLERYGCAYTTQTDIMKEKSKQTKLERYGNAYWNNPEKVMNTVLEKYNCDSVLKNEDIKNKIKQTCLERYGVEYWNQSEYGRMVVSYFMSLPGTQAKINETKRKNHTFNTSKPEDKCYNILIEKYNKEDVLRQYKSDVYPFVCDFYIKSINTYIECNFHWTHCGHLFDSNNKDDINKLEQLNEKAKTSKFYKNAIKVWTERDVNKHNVAKKNNLNYLTFYNEKDFIDYFNET